jgi:hypothetical protein
LIVAALGIFVSSVISTLTVGTAFVQGPGSLGQKCDARLLAIIENIELETIGSVHDVGSDILEEGRLTEEFQRIF